MSQRLKILVVDDEPVNIRVMGTMLRPEGFTVLEASTGETCLQMVRREQPDIVLLDVVLPSLSGPQVSERIKADPELAGTYVILVSEKKISSDDRVMGLVGGADSYLPRPFTKAELLAHITSGARVRALIRRLSEEVEQRQRSESALRETVHEMTRLREIEREHELSSQRLAVVRNLHDGIGGIAANIKMLAEAGLAASDDEGLRAAMEAVSALASEGVSEVRTFMDVLEDTTPTWRDLFVEMRRYGLTVLEPHGIALEASAEGALLCQSMPLVVYMAVLRVFKEAIMNVIKHAGASVVRLTMAVSEPAVVLTVEDDGRGMRADPPPGRGLPSMQARVRDIGGVLAVSAAARGRGTALTITLPLAAASSVTSS